ncbi:hypothetical protein HK102_002240 [Quaeritorhiza haematococci]|nr:hypothetical protein HK102_002240 [Quaeritorhiza haematococci]
MSSATTSGYPSGAPRSQQPYQHQPGPAQQQPSRIGITEPRTSHTHPINISWLFPPELLLLQVAMDDPSTAKPDSKPSQPGSAIDQQQSLRPVVDSCGVDDLLDLIWSPHPGLAPPLHALVAYVHQHQPESHHHNHHHHLLPSISSKKQSTEAINGSGAPVIHDATVPVVPESTAAIGDDTFASNTSAPSEDLPSGTGAPTTSNVVDATNDGEPRLGRYDIEEAEAGVRDEKGLILGEEEEDEDALMLTDEPSPVQQQPKWSVMTDHRVHGNLALSSCPGKKVRLETGPVNGRAMINRDLDTDFARMASMGIRTVVNCLNDAELSFLGASWPKYYESATKLGIDVLRIPMIEGSCPDSVEQVEVILAEMDRRIKQGTNVLCHCRGGVGRAGLVACCYLLRQQYLSTADRSIHYVRMRRSPKAIETRRQEDFIREYWQWLVKNGGPPAVQAPGGLAALSGSGAVTSAMSGGGITGGVGVSGSGGVATVGA